MKRSCLVKLGGSLLHWPGLVSAWKSWRSSMNPKEDIWVLPGGGRAADCVRELQALHNLDDALCHFMALDAMKMNEKLVTHLIQMEPRRGKTRTFLYSVNEAIAALDSQAPGLPQDWSATSDAIALGAGGIGFQKVILLKSVGPRAGGSLEEAIGRGWVDEWSQRHGMEWLKRNAMPCELVNLRAWGDPDSGNPSTL